MKTNFLIFNYKKHFLISATLLLGLLLAGLSTSAQTNTFPTNGNVGIGTLTPQHALDVNGNARVSGNLLVGGGIITASVVNSTGQVNAGDINATSNLNVAGNSIISGSLIMPSLATGTANIIKPVFVDQNGNFKINPNNPNPEMSTACSLTNPFWYVGGNTILGSGANNITAGTCDNYDFILKANNSQRQWIKVDGKIGFGIQNPGSTTGPEYQFNNGVVRLSGMNSFGGPQLIFDGGINQHGDWGIEYLSSTLTPVPGLNFWKPSGSPNSFNYLFFIGDDGRITVGDQTEATSSRFNVDGWSSDGIRSKVNANSKGYSVFNKNSSLESFAVNGNGKTQIGITAANPTALITLTGASPDNALEVRNVATPNNISFLIQTDGSAIVKSTNTLFALDVKDASNITNFRVKSNGFVYAREVRVMTGLFPDYVFDKNYKLLTIKEVDSYILKNKHLPGFESADYYIENGINTSEMFVKQQETIENLTLYIIELEKRLSALEKK